MRVLYLEPSGLVTGGAVALLRLIEAMDRRRFEPLVVLGSDGPLAVRFRRIPGCRVLVRPFPGGLGRTTRFNALSRGVLHVVSWFRYGLLLRAIARRWEADVVHANGLKMHLLSAIIGRRTTKLLIWHIRDLVAPPYMPRRTAWLVRWLARRVPDVVVCNSETTRRAVAGPTTCGADEAGKGRTRTGRRTVETVPDGIAAGQAGARRATVTDDHRPARRVVMLGRIARWKGQDVFVRAAARLCERDASTTFLVAGHATSDADEAFERDLRSQVDGTGRSDRIRFLGLVEDVPGLLASTDVVAHCSTSPEPFGQVVLEAMAASVPVVATSVGGPAEIITDGVNGRLVPPADHEALATVLNELLENHSMRRQLAENGLAAVRTRFGIEQTVRQVTRIYEGHAEARQREAVA